MVHQECHSGIDFFFELSNSLECRFFCVVCFIFVLFVCLFFVFVCVCLCEGFFKYSLMALF